MTSTLKDTWNRLLGKRNAEPHNESVDGLQADAAAAEHLGGVDPASLIGDEEAPPS